MLKVLKSKQGIGAIIAIVITLVLLLIFCLAMEYFRIYTIANGVNEAAQESINTLAIQNADKAYSYLREGQNNINYDSQTNLRIRRYPIMLQSSLGLISEDLLEFKKLVAGGKTEYILKDFNVIYTSTPLIFTASFKLVVPVRFAGKIVTYAEIPLKRSSNYQNKF